VGGEHPKIRNMLRNEDRVRSREILPEMICVGHDFQRHQIASGVLVLLSDTTMHHLQGADSLCTARGPCAGHQTSIGSTTGPGFLTKLRAPEGNTS
jgi:hypothetical protein